MLLYLIEKNMKNDSIWLILKKGKININRIILKN